MSLDSRREGDRVVIVVTGELDIAAAPELVTAASDALAQRSVAGVDVDLSMVTFIDSSGLGALVTINKQASAQNKTLAVFKPGNQARQVLHMTGLDEVLTVVPDSDNS